MTEFQEMVEEAVRKTCVALQNQDDLGVAATYFSMEEDSVVVHAMNADGKPTVSVYCAELKKHLPVSSMITNNSPTDGSLLVSKVHSGGKPCVWEPDDHLKVFTAAFEQFRITRYEDRKRYFGNHKLYIAMVYLDSYIDRCDEEDINLKPDEEFLDQIIALDFNL